MSKNQEYIDKYAEIAMQNMKRYGIPASVTLAQGILESANGKSELSQKGNNHFGMKASSSWLKNGGGYLLYDDDKPNEKFCKYGSAGESYEHHSRLLAGSQRYADCFKLASDDYVGWTKGLQKAGYASDKNYAKSLQSIITANNLQKFDQQVIREVNSKGKEQPSTKEIQVKGLEKEQNPQINNTIDPDKSKVVGQEYSMPVARKEFLLITSQYGVRNDPINKGQQQMHKGIDISMKYEPVLATETGGRVISTNENAKTAGGKSITVEYDRADGSKYQCTYMHLKDIDVSKGDTVNAGQKIGTSGNTGTRTTGPHLHFGVKTISTDGTSKDIDPAIYLAEIAQRGELKQQAMFNGTDLIAKNAQKASLMIASTGDKPDPPEVTPEDLTAMSPESWMKKLLSSEDSGIQNSMGDPIMDKAFALFTSLLVLATQIDNRSDAEKNQKITDALTSKHLDLGNLVPNLKACSITLMDNGTAMAHVDTGSQQFAKTLSDIDNSKLRRILDDKSLTSEQMKQKVAGTFTSFAIYQMVSSKYNDLESQQQMQTENLRR